MLVSFHGGSSESPKVLPLKKGTRLDREVQKMLPSLTNLYSLLLACGPGSGKTYTACNTIIPWAKANGYPVLYVSSRVALNMQTKRSLLQVLGQENLLSELTAEGLQKKEDFDGVSIITYHRLYGLMRSVPERLEKFRVLIFDEVHALLDDALFVSTTGYIQQHLWDCFKYAIRIFMSGTAQEIIPLLADVDRPFQLHVLRMPADYSGIRLRFFHNPAEIARRINEDTTNSRWLVYFPTISEGEQFRRSLNCSTIMLNRQERERNPEAWNEILRNEKFEEKAGIATAVVDVGVNFKDPSLKHIVVCSFSLITNVQVLGRKRRNKGEAVNFYAWCPTLEDVGKKLAENAILQEAEALYHTNYPTFIDTYAIRAQNLDLRNWLRVDDDGMLELNPLVRIYLRNEQSHLERLQSRAARSNGDCRFDQLVATALGLPLPPKEECWLDARYNGEARAAFEAHLRNHVHLPMDDSAFSSFSSKFQALCYAAFGKSKGGKDRDDRTWGIRKINSKLKELQYDLEIRQEQRTYFLVNIGDMEVHDDDSSGTDC